MEFDGGEGEGFPFFGGFFDDGGDGCRAGGEAPLEEEDDGHAVEETVAGPGEGYGDGGFGVGKFERPEGLGDEGFYAAEAVDYKAEGGELAAS